MKKTNNMSIPQTEITERVFLLPAEVAEILRIGENSLYTLLGSDDCPFPVKRLNRQLIRIPARAFFDWVEGE